MDPQNSNEQPIATSADGTLNEARHLRSQKKRPKADISGGWTDLTLRNSYLAGALKHAVYKPRGKPSDVWTRGIFAIYKADDAIVPDWYICKRKDEMMNDCNQLFNIKLRDGNSRLREHCDKHDQKENQEKFFRISYDQMVSALDKANLFGDNYGVVSFRQLLPRPEVMEIWNEDFFNGMEKHIVANRGVPLKRCIVELGPAEQPPRKKLCVETQDMAMLNESNVSSSSSSVALVESEDDNDFQMHDSALMQDENDLQVPEISGSTSPQPMDHVEDANSVETNPRKRAALEQVHELGTPPAKRTRQAIANANAKKTGKDTAKLGKKKANAAAKMKKGRKMSSNKLLE